MNGVEARLANVPSIILIPVRTCRESTFRAFLLMLSKHLPWRIEGRLEMEYIARCDGNRTLKNGGVGGGPKSAVALLLTNECILNRYATAVN